MTAELLPYLRDLYGSHVTGYHGRDKTFNRGPLTDDVLRGHLEGRWRVGTYFDPGDGTVTLGVIDLDNEKNPDGEKPYAKRAAEVLPDLGLSAEIFTSKGKGYHVPVYFAEPVPAWVVRKVLTYAAMKAGRPTAEIFPKQDIVDVYIPPVGSEESARVGNFINLPFHGADLPRGRTALLNKANGLDPYPDQVEGAEGIKKNSAEDLMGALAMIGEDSTPPVRKPAGPVGDKLTEGQRRPTLFSFAGSMRDRGATAEEILPALQAMNANRCDPLLPEEELWKLAKGTERYEPKRPVRVAEVRDTPGEDAPLILDPADPMPSARLFLQTRHSLDGKPILGYHRGAPYRWDGKSYRPEGDAEIECGGWGFLEEALRRVKVKEEWSIVPFKPNRARVGDVLAALRAVANIPAEIEPPAWISSGAAATDFLPMQNGILDLRDGKLLPSSPDLFAIGAVDYDYDPQAECPNWHRFLTDLLDDDLERRDLLADWFGYALTADTRQQKILLIVGPKRSGKGTIARVLSGVVGSENVCNPTAASLGTHFGLVPLIGKRLAIIGDARMGGNTDSYLLAERLLSISGEDGITIDRKYREEWTGHLGVRFVILSNELPRFADPSGAIASRFLILPLEESFLGREDETLTERLLGERAGILNWALEGLARLRGRRHFLQPSAAAEMIREVEDLSSPVAAFIRDKVEKGPLFEVEVGALHNAYLAWCASMGREYKEHVQGFARDFRAAWEGKLRTKRPRWGGERTRVYCGLRLKT